MRAVGFDPAPGDAVAAAVAARRLAAAAADLDGTAAVLDAMARPVGAWAGAAATAFAGAAAALPVAVAGERDAFLRAGAVLGGWARDLDGFQARARDLDALAVAARTAEEVAAVVGQARALAEEHARAAAAVAAALAPDPGATNPGATDATSPGSWLGEHLDDIGDVAGAISGVAGALAFVPVLTPVMAPVALASGAVALAADVADATVHDKWDEHRTVTEVGADVAGLVPGVRFAAGTARAAGDAVAISSAFFRSVDGLAPAAMAGAETFARGEAAAAAVYRQPGVWAVAKGKALAAKTGVGADLAARGFEVQSRLTRAATRAGRVGEEDQPAKPAS